MNGNEKKPTEGGEQDEKEKQGGEGAGKPEGEQPPKTDAEEGQSGK